MKTNEKRNDVMTANDYQKRAHEFATGGGDTMAYAVLGLIEEVGELCGKMVIADRDLMAMFELTEQYGKLAGVLAKNLRKNYDALAEKEKASVGLVTMLDGFDKEVGDVQWMLANVAHHAGKRLGDIMRQNISKLDDRKKRGVIVGEGDNR